MKKYFNKLLQNKFIKNVVIVLTGTAGAQAITMAFAPVITRIYGPENFGLLGSFLAILTVFIPVAALTYPIAIVLPKSDDQAIGIAKLSAGLAFITAVFVTIISVIFGEKFLELVGLANLGHYLFLIPLAMFFAGIQQIFQQWLIRKKKYKISAKAAIFHALALNTSKTGLGLFHPVAYVLIWLVTLGHLLHAFLLWTGTRKEYGESSKINNIELRGEEIEPVSLKKLAFTYKDFPLFRAPQVLINAASQSMPILMLAAFFGPAAAGFYALGKMVMAAPSGLIGKSVADVFYPRITEAAHNKENVSKLILKATLALAAVGFLPFAIVVIFGPWLFSFVFGSEWSTAGEYARWLAIWLYFGFLNRPSVAAIATLGLQHLFLLYEIVSVVLRIIALYVGFMVYQSDIHGIALFSLTGVFLNAFLIWLTLYKSSKENN